MYKMIVFECLRISNPVLRDPGSSLLVKVSSHISKLQKATVTYFAPPPYFEEIEWPTERKVKTVPKMPPSLLPGKPKTMPKRMDLMRGPELVHNFLIYKQYGLQALTGGRLNYKNFEFLRMALKKFDCDKAFTLWRVDPPWQPVSKKGRGKKMGGGKAPVHHFVTPVKAGRIIVEVGGTLHPKEVKLKLAPLAENLPFPARYVTQEILEQEVKDKKWQEENNLNPYTFKYVILNNMGGCNNWLSPYDYFWFGEHR